MSLGGTKKDENIRLSKLEEMGNNTEDRRRLWHT